MHCNRQDPFIIMTCKPNCPEIKDNLLPNTTGQTRPGSKGLYIKNETLNS